MRWVLAALVWLGGCLAVWAQDLAPPQVTVDLSDAETVVGQPLVLRIKVLVPTWMPSPPAFPNLEVPGVMVRLPERASGPVSERVEGETWSGVQRAYRLYPLQVGGFEIPATTLRLDYADPANPSAPVRAEIALDPVRFRSVLPEGAEGLDPPIVASGFSLEQTVEGDTALEPGGAVTRRVVATIEGTTPVLIPALLGAEEDAALRAYPAEPVVRDKSDRGRLSGSRDESVTYVAQAGGDVELAAVSFDWFNLETGAVETALVPAVSLTITGDLPAPPLDRGEVLRQAILALLALLLLGLGARWAMPRVRGRLAARRAAWEASEPYAFAQLNRAVSRGDLTALYAALTRWQSFYPDLNASAREEIERQLAGLGAAAYAAEGVARPDRGGLRRALAEARRGAKGRATPGALPPLNG